ncbi:ATP-binding cassette domain-containing protein [Novosphingopyxis sp. YJ-S2-01]|uniref:ATP-binding cassette domain-containing protein n=1 Tax=Novosphingopyxis sp. YJ-S2-01 TaxID=2794021 RepID=UPI0018DC5EBB|nr:ATP-binding cassette domain-containing protein [Novosphingopyxis sp. YJ-S2-01]MBH9537103.1 ATP-binding cassette domain-containing protein [Novosphingopyxis sp. YJ-S2-01]
MSADCAIVTERLTKNFGKHRAVVDLSLEVPARCVFGFLGPNGAGKSTTMRLMLGLLKPSSGTVRLFGQDVSRERVTALRGVGSVIENPALYEHRSGRENLAITAGLLGLPATEIDRALDIVDLSAAAGRKVRGYSLGMKQRLALARAMLGNPRLLLLDEPTNGLDPEGIVVMRSLIRELPERTGCTVFLSSHLLGEVEQTASVVGLMKAGRLVLEGTTSALLAEGGVIRIGLDDADRACALLKKAGFDVIDSGRSLDGTDWVDLHAGDGPAQHEATARCNRLLVEAGMAVHAIGLRARTLEQLYHDASSVSEQQP